MKKIVLVSTDSGCELLYVLRKDGEWSSFMFGMDGPLHSMTLSSYDPSNSYWPNWKKYVLLGESLSDETLDEDVPEQATRVYVNGD